MLHRKQAPLRECSDEGSNIALHVGGVHVVIRGELTGDFGNRLSLFDKSPDARTHQVGCEENSSTDV